MLTLFSQVQSNSTV